MLFVNLYFVLGWALLAIHMITLMRGEVYNKVLKEEIEDFRKSLEISPHYNGNPDVAAKVYLFIIAGVTFIVYTFFWPAVLYFLNRK